MKPLVTIGVCVRNCECSIREALNSILNQDFPHEHMEIIFVDDGSTDKTLPIILDFVSRIDVNTKIFNNEWRGLGKVRNAVVDNARGDYIIWVDGDMILPTEHTRKQVEFMQRNPNVGIAKAKHEARLGEKLVTALENLPYLVEDFRNEKRITPKLLGTGGSIYRVEAIRQVGGFDDNIKGAGEDLDAARRVMTSGWKFGRTQTTFYERRRQTWKALWDEYFWWGYGMHQALHKHEDLLVLYRMIPIAGFLAGLLYSFDAYKMSHQKRVFLLPLQFMYKLIAWWLGFAKGHIDSFRQRKNRLKQGMPL